MSITHSKLVLAALFASAVGIAAVEAAPREVEARPLEAFPREQVAIETRSARRHVFDAWRADTDETRAQGLMFVNDMAESQAMIFVYDPPQHIRMWMKNTYMPLDMVFADDHGCIVKIQQNAKPLSLDTIDSRVPVAYVLEIKAGIAKARAISLGDRLLRAGDEKLAQTQTRCTH